MRKYMGLFRGNLKASNEWAFGNLQVTKSGVAIITPDDTPIGKYGQVDPETVGECAGLKDKNGKLIFEGDIIGNPYNVVEYCLGAWTVNGDVPLAYYAKSHEVIGNIHDNPELLEESK